MSNPKKRKAFSLLELLAVVVILGIIAAIVVPRVTSSADLAKKKVNLHNKAAINAAVERFYIDTGGWPSTDLSNMGADYFPDGPPKSPFDGATSYTIDGTSHRVDNIPDP
jgi:general secretion pathway protein G